MATYTDPITGLLKRQGVAEGTVDPQGTMAWFTRDAIVINIEDATEIPATAATPNVDDPRIPAGAFITNAYVMVETGFTSGGSAALNIGLYEADGSTIDVDGIDAAVAVADLGANKAVVCDGAYVGGTVMPSVDAYIQLDYDTAAFTAGAGKVVIEYINFDH